MFNNINNENGIDKKTSKFIEDLKKLINSQSIVMELLWA